MANPGDVLIDGLQKGEDVFYIDGLIAVKVKQVQKETQVKVVLLPEAINDIFGDKKDDLRHLIEPMKKDLIG